MSEGLIIRGQTIKPERLEFYDRGEHAGTLYIENPMRFEGDADAAARGFWDATNVEVTRRILEVVDENVALKRLLKRCKDAVDDCYGHETGPIFGIDLEEAIDKALEGQG